MLRSVLFDVQPFLTEFKVDRCAFSLIVSNVSEKQRRFSFQILIEIFNFDRFSLSLSLVFSFSHDQSREMAERERENKP